MGGIYKTEDGRHAVESFYRKALERWPVTHEHIVLPTRHGDTFVIASGPAAAPPVVLLHGSGSNSLVWIRDAGVWATRYRVYAVDIIGEPGLSAPSRPSLRSDAYDEWLDDVCKGLALDSASLVGVSLGGWMALDYAIKHGPHVRSLSLLSPAGIGARKSLFMVKAAVMRLLGPFGVRRALSAATGRAPLPPGVAQYVALIFEHFRPRREAPPIRSDAELGSLSIPVQVIVGANDAMLDARQTRDRTARLIPHAEITFIEHAGHMLPPQTSRIDEFVGRAWSATGAKQAARA